MRRYTHTGMAGPSPTSYTIDLFNSPEECLRESIRRSSGVDQPDMSPLRAVCARRDWSGVSGIDQLSFFVSRGVSDALSDTLAKEVGKVRATEELRPVVRRWDVAGGSLSVPRHLSGDPLCLRHRVKGPSRSRIMEIVVLTTVSHDVPLDIMERIGRCLGTVVGVLGGMGYSIGISTLSLARFAYRPEDRPPQWVGKEDIRGMGIRIKRPDAVFNPRRVSFAFSRVLARALFIAYYLQLPDRPRTYARQVLGPQHDNDIFDIIDELHPGDRIVMDSEDLANRMMSGWDDDRCMEMLLSSVRDHT